MSAVAQPSLVSEISRLADQLEAAYQHERRSKLVLLRNFALMCALTGVAILVLPRPFGLITYVVLVVTFWAGHFHSLVEARAERRRHV